jgi:hypothetical protein
MSVKKSESLSESNKVSEFGYQTNFNFKGEQPNPLAQTPNNFTTLIPVLRNVRFLSILSLNFD